MHIKWPTVILILGLGFLLTCITALLKIPSPSKSTESDSYQTGVIETLGISHLGPVEWGASPIDVFTVKDAYSKQVYLIYLCAPTPEISKGAKVMLEYRKKPNDSSGCHVLQKMTAQ